MAPPLLVSACLVGFRCRYDGETKRNRRVIAMLEGHEWIPVCPEQAAGLPTPRAPMAFAGGTGDEALKGTARLIQDDGRDVTNVLIEASRSLIRLGKAWGIGVAILKEGSPSCGVVTTYVGEEKVKGKGIFAALLEAEGVKTFSEETLPFEGKFDDF